MAVEDQSFHYLFCRFVENKATPKELDAFWRHVQCLPEEELNEALAVLWQQTEEEKLDNKDWNGVREKIHARAHAIDGLGRRKKYRIPRRSWITTAAAVLCLIIGGALLLWRQIDNAATEKVASHFMNDVAPGQNGAILQLADGTQIVLDSAVNGTIAVQGGASIDKDGSQIMYQQVPADDQEGAVSYNTIITPRGRQFSIKLPDGTAVWLNAGASLRYPTIFHEERRVVELSGEAYFEVAKDARRPFHVQTANGVDVRVLGTHFNINAYEDEPFVRTTLVEGSVEVSGISQSRTLVPRQQAMVDNRTGRLSVKEVNTRNVLAWKDGNIVLSGNHIEAIMRQVARWYDVDIQYSERLSKTEEFVGKISRDQSLIKVLEILEKTGMVHFSIDGRNVKVMP